MSDDWRVRAEVRDAGGSHELLKKLHELEREVEEVLPQRLAVTANDTGVFVYAGDQAQADEAAAAINAIIAEHGIPAEVTVTRWHPDSETWETADVALPATPEEQAAEHARLEAREAQESQTRGAQWEVRIDLGSRHEAIAVAERLEAEGLTPLRRWTHVFISTATDDDAQALAERLRAELPSGAKVTVEGTAADAWRATHPYAALGGIAN
jgi:hypothetical protein